jgi:hypothetical protein
MGFREQELRDIVQMKKVRVGLLGAEPVRFCHLAQGASDDCVRYAHQITVTPIAALVLSS